MAIYWAIKTNITKDTDMASLLLGAASLALFVFSIFIALFAGLGWQTVINSVRDAAEKAAIATLERVVNEAVAKPIQNLREQEIYPMKEARLKLEEEMKAFKAEIPKELRGRALTILGYVIGEPTLNPADLRLKRDDIRHEEDLAEAVRLCQEGYDQLKDLGDKEKYLGLNNLVYYTSAYGGDKDQLKKLLRNARDLREAAEKKYNEKGLAANALLSAYRAILEHGTDPEERTEVRNQIEAMMTNEAAVLSRREMREAKIYLKHYTEGLPPLQPNPGETLQG